MGCKRARTNLQKQRNDALIGAEKALKEKLGTAGDVKVDWESRRVVSKGEAAFEQRRGEVSGIYLSPCATLVGYAIGGEHPSSFAFNGEFGFCDADPLSGCVRLSSRICCCRRFRRRAPRFQEVLQRGVLLWVSD